MANLVLKNKKHTDVMLELYRGDANEDYASWRMINSSGTLYLKCNYTDKVVDYFNVFTLAYNTGHATLKGNLAIGGNLSVPGSSTLTGTITAGNIMTFNHSSADNHKITSNAGAMHYSSHSTTYLSSGTSSSIIFQPCGVEQGRFGTDGYLQLKSGGTANATLVGPAKAGTFKFPDTGGTFVTHETKGTAVGGGTQPVYIASTGRVTASTSTVGTSTKPVHLNAGIITECSTYAGGTKVTLNGSNKGASTASFYAPTGAGTSGQLLVSSGGAPTWKSLADIADSRYVNTAGDTMTGTLKIKSGDAGNWTEGIRIAPASNGWTTLILGSSADSGTGVGAWSFHTYDNHFYLAHNGSNNGSPMITGIPNDGFNISGTLNLANGTWNKVGDDAYFGDNNTAGSFAIKGQNGYTNLKLVSNNGADSCGYITYNQD